MSKHNWTAEQLGDQTGRVAIVTGSNSGIGFETARVLAAKGATVVMACRNLDKANPKADEIRGAHPNANVEVMELDLSDLDSVRRFAEAFRAKHSRLDLLINNAGIMVPPVRENSAGLRDSVRGQPPGTLRAHRIFARPHHQHAGLTHRHREQRRPPHMGKIQFSDLNWEKGYKAQPAYGQSKLANLLFTYELQRRLAAAGKDTLAVAAHPGWTETNLQEHAKSMKFLNRFLRAGAVDGRPAHPLRGHRIRT